MGSVYFQEPSTDGAPGIWDLDDALRYQALGKWPTIPATVPDWIKRGPDGALPVDQADYALGNGWFNGRPYPNLFAYMDAAGGAFSRGSDATYFGRDRILRNAGPNVLRLDHDPATGKALGARLEGARTNLISYSADYDAGVWAKNFMIAEGNVAVAPDGTTTADRLSRDAVSNFPRASRNINYAAGWRATSFFGKGDECRWVAPTCAPSILAYFDIIDGVVGAGGPAPSRGMARMANGWYRPWIASALEGGSQETRIPAFASADGTLSLSGLPAGIGIHAWGAQVEAGQFASSYIPTGATSATRLADSLTFARAAPPEGTVAIEGRSPLGTGGNQVLWQWDDGTDANRYRLVRVNGGNLRAIMTVTGVDVVNLDLGPVANDADLKVVPSWRAGQFAASLNGAAAVVDTSYTGPLPVVSTVRCGSGVTSGDKWYGTMARLGAFNRAYSPAELPEVWA